MKSLSLDLETYSDVNLAKCGVYKYAESPAFEILLFGYAVDGGPVQVVDLAQGESIPEENPGCPDRRHRYQVGLQCQFRTGVFVPAPHRPGEELGPLS